MERAGDELGVETSVLESQSEADFEPNINSFIEEDCSLIVTVGFLLGDATLAAAQDNPDTEFAIVDFAYEETPDNLIGLTFSTDQAAFLAGYVAAGMTETGKVGTYGGINIPTVTVFMDGFALGVDQFNADNGTEVEVLGWDPEAQEGLFTGDFEDQTKGRQTTDQLIEQGADIIMPVAGPVGLGSIESIRAGGGTERLIWVDTDGCVTLPDACDLILTSVQKKMDNAVFDTIQSAVDGSFEGGGVYVGTLENDGVALAPFHEFDGDVPQDLKDRVAELTQQIIDGEVETSPAG
jgi:basic membrane protein A